MGDGLYSDPIWIFVLVCIGAEWHVSPEEEITEILGRLLRVKWGVIYLE